MILFMVSLVSYIIGSIPFGLVLVYIFTGKNIKKHGSGNIGATNVLRVSGFTLALITLFLDSTKGFIIAVLCKYYNLPMWFIPGLAAVLGHIFPIWLKFKGGKGVATSLGLLLAIDYYLFIISISTWLFIAVLSRVSSLSAIITFILLPIYSFILDLDISLIISLTILSIVIIYKHKSNIIRIINKQEDKINLTKKNG